MYFYTTAQWVLFFFWYCFLGWIWECSYVSVKKALKTKRWKWTNRGFLNGPVIPIYGFAALTILLATIPVKESIPHIFVLGALAASLMELVTGSTMERLFHVKYWDYSDLPLNYHGYVCFYVSLFWGLLAIFTVRVIHVPVETFLLKIPNRIVEIVSFLCMAIFAFDFSESLREALDMRDLLEKLTECKEVIQRLENRVDAIVAFTTIHDIDELREIPGTAKERWNSRLEEKRQRRLDNLHKLSEKLKLDEVGELFGDKEELLSQIEKQIHGVFSRTNKQYWRVSKHLRRNPSAISKKYGDALKEIRGLLDK